MRALGYDVKKAEVLRLMREYDRDESGFIDQSDFTDIVTQKLAERDPMEEIRKAFRLFADEDTQKIGLKNMRRVARELGESMSDEELQAMIDEFDADKDGMISEDEFIAIMTQSSSY